MFLLPTLNHERGFKNSRGVVMKIFFNGDIDLDEEDWSKIYARIQAFFDKQKIGEIYFEVEP